MTKNLDPGYIFNRANTSKITRAELNLFIEK